MFPRPGIRRLLFDLSRDATRVVRVIVYTATTMIVSMVFAEIVRILRFGMRLLQNYDISILSLDRASLICNGLFLSICFALSTFSEESFGLLATHGISVEEAGFMRFLSSLKVSATCWANSYLVRRVAPARCKIPVTFLSDTSSVISARLEFKVGEFHWSVAAFACSFFPSFSMSHSAKFVFPVDGIDPKSTLVLAMQCSALDCRTASSPFSFVSP